MTAPNTSLGQHWLHDRAVLTAMCDLAELTDQDTVLEIGPGLGTLTHHLAKRAKQVIAVEFDRELAEKLPGRVPAANLSVFNQDFLQFNLLQLPEGYKVVANLPYYITSKITQRLATAINAPSVSVLLVQKEVAERMAAPPGELSILGVATQYYSQAHLGEIIPARLFTPPPKVDSQVIRLTRRPKLLFDIASEHYFRVVKAGFSAKRKMLRSSLSGGLALPKPQTEAILAQARIDPAARAEMLSLDDWARLTKAWLAAEVVE